MEHTIAKMRGIFDLIETVARGDCSKILYKQVVC